MVVLFCSSIAQNGAIAHLSALLTDRGVSAGGGALALSAMGGAGLAGRLVDRWLLDRFFAARVSFVLLAIAALGTFLLSGAVAPDGRAGRRAIGFGMGGEADVTPYLLSRYFGLRSFSTLYGFTWTAYACAGAVGPILMGKAFDATGSYERCSSVSRSDARRRRADAAAAALRLSGQNPTIRFKRAVRGSVAWKWTSSTPPTVSQA